MCLARVKVAPALDPGEEPLNPGPVALDRIPTAAGSPPFGHLMPAAVAFGPDRDQVLGAAEDKSVLVRVIDGRPLSVLRVMAGSETFQPSPNGPLPAPES